MGIPVLGGVAPRSRNPQTAATGEFQNPGIFKMGKLGMPVWGSPFGGGGDPGNAGKVKWGSPFGGGGGATREMPGKNRMGTRLRPGTVDTTAHLHSLHTRTMCTVDTAAPACTIDTVAHTCAGAPASLKAAARGRPSMAPALPSPPRPALSCSDRSRVQTMLPRLTANPEARRPSTRPGLYAADCTSQPLPRTAGRRCPSG